MISSKTTKIISEKIWRNSFGYSATQKIGGSTKHKLIGPTHAFPSPCAFNSHTMDRVVSKPAIRNRIRSDRYHFAGSDRQALDADPDPYLFQPNVNYGFFPENFNIVSKIFKLWHPMTLMRKVKQTGTAVDKSNQKNKIFQHDWRQNGQSDPDRHRNETDRQHFENCMFSTRTKKLNNGQRSENTRRKL